MTKAARKSLFERLQKGLQEGIAHTQGELTLKTVEIPEKPPEIDAATLAEIRIQTAMSQAVFARILSVSTKTLQSWEQGLRKPSEASRRLIQVFTTRPEVFCQSLGLPEIRLEGVRIAPLGQGRSKIVIERKTTKSKRQRP